MKIVLRQTIRTVGQAGAIVEVSDAYARNYLIPKGLAVVATADAVTKAAAAIESKRAAGEKAHRDLQTAQAKLNNVTVTIAGQGQPGKHLYQAIKSAQIIAAVERQYDVRLPRVTIDPVSLKSVGLHQVKLIWPKNQTTTITVVVEIEPSKPTSR